MAINNFRKVNLTIDKANDYIIEPLHVMQGDLQGRELFVQITNGGSVEEQSDLVLNLGWYHTGVETKGLNAFEPVDADQGIFTIRYDDNMLTPGKVAAVIQIITTDGIINTRPFEIVIGKNPIDATAIIAGDSFTALNEALDRAESWNRIIDEVLAELTARIEQSAQNLIDEANRVEAEYPQRLSDLEAVAFEQSFAWEKISGKPSTFNPSLHQHSAEDIASGTLSLNTSGNAASATKLQTAQPINGVYFDGTAPITITANPNAHNHPAGTISYGTFPNLITAHSNTDYTIRQIRNIVLVQRGNGWPSTASGDIIHEYS